MEFSQIQTDEIARINDEGIVFEFPAIGTVIGRQMEIIYNQIFTNKQLHAIARAIFPESKVIPVVYSLDLSIVTIEWVAAQMTLYRITAKDLQRQIGFKKETINDFLKLRKTLKPLEK